ncbi:MAG: hypothetical protein NC117_05300 [Pseudoflavonifractor sp.]|nr:hypothetical protein [Pseudoflavonifractor sp.]
MRRRYIAWLLALILASGPVGLTSCTPYWRTNNGYHQGPHPGGPNRPGNHRDDHHKKPPKHKKHHHHDDD